MGEDYAFIFYQKYIGEKHNMLTIESYYGLDKHKRPLFNCICDCGNHTIASLNKLKQGTKKSCGCLKRKKSKVSIGEQHNYLTVEKILDKKDSHGLYLCLCSCVCGNHKIVSIYDLVHNRVKSCGCKQSNYKDLKGMKFGLLTPERYLGSSTWSDRSALWLCKCDCGNYCEKTRHALFNGTKSCGCIKSSYGETIVNNILKEKGLKRIREYKYIDCLSPNGFPCKFDFAVIDENFNVLFLIEYQGKQHFDNSYGDFGKLEREYTDKIKKEYCKQNNIPLLTIRFDEDPQEKIDSYLKSLAS